MTRCMRPVRRSRKASFRAAASPCSGPPRRSRASAPRTTTRRPASRSCARRSPRRPRQNRDQRRRRRLRHRRQDPGEGPVQLRLRLADRRVWQPGHKGIIDPTKVSRCDPERSLRRGAPDHHRSMIAELPKKNAGAGGGGMPPGGGMGGHGFLIRGVSRARCGILHAVPQNRDRNNTKCKTPAAMSGFLFALLSPVIPGRAKRGPGIHNHGTWLDIP